MVMGYNAGNGLAPQNVWDKAQRTVLQSCQHRSLASPGQIDSGH